MFYKTGIDITNDRQMFEFLKNHFEYWTANSWNRLGSIANNVKMYNLKLTGDWSVAYDLLASGEYETINFMIEDWCREHPGYMVFFNGRSGGYLVLGNSEDNRHILPECIIDVDTYDDYKERCREDYGSVKANRDELRYYTKLVQDFDRLCDELRDYCDGLSKQKFEFIEMEKSVEEFNNRYADDLEYLGFQYLKCSEDGKVDVSEIGTLECLLEAFLKLADRSAYSYKLVFDDDGQCSYQSLY